MSYKKREVITVQIEKFCFCKRDMMSVCTAGSKSEQKKCKFYKKSSFTDKCMHFMFDEFCDCVEAQLAFQHKIQKGQVDSKWI
jgi:hypothetical protein